MQKKLSFIYLFVMILFLFNNSFSSQILLGNVSNPASAVPVPKPIIAQSFNTAATQNTFDIYMGGGGFGAHNGCGPGLGATSTSGEYLYEKYPEEDPCGEYVIKITIIDNDSTTTI